MSVIATYALGFAIAGLVLLFVYKAWEIRSGIVIASSARKQLDRRARRTKIWIFAILYFMVNLPARSVVVGRVLLHAGAVGFAKLARYAEGRAHDVADLVSHKHRFERRETKSKFLKEVESHKSTLQPENGK